jgi:prevent-host-death family protein
MHQRAVADVKRDFKRVLDAAEQGNTTVVVRHGRPVALITPVRPTGLPVVPRARKPGGLLALIGTFEEWPEIESDVASIVAGRQDALDRPPPTFD